MNYLAELNAFYDWLETNPLATSDIALWYALMHIANKAGWPDTFAVAVSVLELKTGLKKDAIKDARNRLEQRGRIKWESRKGNQSAIYTVVGFAAVKQPQTPPHSPPQSPPQYPPHSPPINKLNETKLNQIVTVVPEEEPEQVYTNEVGLLTPTIAECIADDVAVYGKLWVVGALRVAAKSGKRNMKYAEGILKNWKAKGHSPQQRPWEFENTGGGGKDGGYSKQFRAAQKKTEPAGETGCASDDGEGTATVDLTGVL